MKILHILPSIDPRGGGPMEGVRQRGVWLNDCGHQVEVVTLDAPEEPFITEYPLKVHALGPSRGGYRYNIHLTSWLEENAINYDVVIINGMWQYNGLGTWRALKKSEVPYFLFTHGMLDPWFNKKYPLKYVKKFLYWLAVEYRVLRDAKAVIFTCDEERILARESFLPYKVNEAVAAYGTRRPPQDADRLRSVFFDKYPELQSKRFFLFLSRIHEKKGIDLLIDAFADVAKKCSQLHLVIAGPDKTDLLPKLKKQADRLGVADRITWPGMLQGDMKWGAFYSAEAFVLTSHQENFGIAVAEALGCGKPVLISNKVNIWREIVQDSAGFVANDDRSGATEILSRYISLTESDRNTMVENARTCFEKRYTVEAMGKSLIDIINSHAK